LGQSVITSRSAIGELGKDEGNRCRRAASLSSARWPRDHNHIAAPRRQQVIPAAAGPTPIGCPSIPRWCPLHLLPVQHVISPAVAVQYLILVGFRTTPCAVKYNRVPVHNIERTKGRRA